MDAGETAAVSVPKPDPKECDHVWEQLSSKSIEDQKDANQEISKGMANSPSMAGTKRGYDFENKAIDANKDVLDIQSCGAEYKCKLCGIGQEVDIVGKDQIAEAKSRTAKGVKNKSKQCTNYKDIQKKLFDPDTPPMAKLDSEHPQHDAAGEVYKRRGFVTEVV